MQVNCGFLWMVESVWALCGHGSFPRLPPGRASRERVPVFLSKQLLVVAWVRAKGPSAALPRRLGWNFPTWIARIKHVSPAPFGLPSNCSLA
jgi:hypothetical protein